MQNAGMAVNITIRNVPDEVRAKIAARAAARGQSMQEYLLGELTRMTEKPSAEEWLGRVRARKAASRSRATTEMILEAIHEGREERARAIERALGVRDET